VALVWEPQELDADPVGLVQRMRCELFEEHWCRCSDLSPSPRARWTINVHDPLETAAEMRGTHGVSPPMSPGVHPI
jgi:hypothetical protein